jgi:hypothetical protein
MPDFSNNVDFTWPKELENNKSIKEKGLDIPYMGRSLASFYHLAPKKNSLLLDCTCPYVVNVDEKNVLTKAERVQQCFRRERNKDIIAITFTGEFKAYVLYPKSEGNPNLNWDRETLKGMFKGSIRFNSAQDVENFGILLHYRWWHQDTPRPKENSMLLVNDVEAPFYILADTHSQVEAVTAVLIEAGFKECICVLGEIDEYVRTPEYGNVIKERNQQRSQSANMKTIICVAAGNKEGKDTKRNLSDLEEGTSLPKEYITTAPNSNEGLYLIYITY